MILNRTCDLPNDRFDELGVEFRLSLTSLIESEEVSLLEKFFEKYL